MASQETKIDFNPDLFNNVYWHLEKAFSNEGVRFIWIYGGSSASKTYSVVQLTVKEMLCSNEHNSLILRKYASDIRDSIYSDFKNIITDWGLQDYFVIQQNYILCSTGSYVRFRGLDDSEKVKGISNFKKVIMEEVSQFDEDDYKQIKKRLRGRKGQQIIGIFNPISEEHWVKKNVFDKDIFIEEDADISGKWINQKGNSIILKTNYVDNKYIVGPHFKDQHVIDDFENDRINDYGYYLIYGLGNWGKLRTGGEFWKDFSAAKHVRSNKFVNNKLVLFDPEEPIRLSWDENVNPFLTCLVWQTKNVKDKNGVTIQRLAIQIDEICLEDPRNRVKHVCNEFIKRYPVELVKGLFIHGDRTSLKEDTKKEKGENFFTDVNNYLSAYRPRLLLQSVNPSIVQSANFINECYARNFEKIEIIIGENCKKSIYDYTYAVEDSDGTLKKSKKTNPLTKVTYEEFGHCSDAKRYILTVVYANEYNTYIRGGKGKPVIMGKNTTKNIY